MLSMTAPTLWLISFNGSFKWAPFKGGFRIPSQSVHIYIYILCNEAPKDHPYYGFGDLVHHSSIYEPPWYGLV